MTAVQCTSMFTALLCNLNRTRSQTLSQQYRSFHSLKAWHHAEKSSCVKTHAVRCLASASQQSDGNKKRVVFLGTPEVAALVLNRLVEASKQPTSSFELVAVVSQPGRPKGRGNKRVPQLTPVHQAAAESGLSEDRILCPEKAGDAEFLQSLRALEPDLCITAAYGNYLPTRFLDIPAFGTLNIHPSLLPLYRGAAPVQRALQDGVKTTGVSVLYTVRAMDAGPILAQEKYEVPPNMQSPELLDLLFTLGTKLLVERLDSVWSGEAPSQALVQDDSQATHAPKLTREEGYLNFAEDSAQVNHNKIRAFVGWPSTYHQFVITSDGGGEETMEVKVLSSEVAADDTWQGESSHEVVVNPDGLLVRCGDGSVLRITHVQPVNKRAMAARDFANGLKGKKVYWQNVTSV